MAGFYPSSKATPHPKGPSALSCLGERGKAHKMLPFAVLARWEFVTQAALVLLG